MATKILTIAVSEEIWKKIKQSAALQGKSISALIREQIEKFLGEENRYPEVHDWIILTRWDANNHITPL